MTLGLSWQISEIHSNIKIHDNPSRRNQVVPCGRRDTHDEANSPFHNFATATKNSTLHSYQRFAAFLYSWRRGPHTPPKRQQGAAFRKTLIFINTAPRTSNLTEHTKLAFLMHAFLVPQIYVDVTVVAAALLLLLLLLLLSSSSSSLLLLLLLVVVVVSSSSFLCRPHYLRTGRDSAVGVTTRYGLDGPGSNSGAV